MHIKIITATFLLVVSMQSSLAQDSSVAWRSYVNLQNYLQPFWTADTIYDEAIQPLRDGDRMAEGRLLFEAKKILSVKDTYLQKEYKKNRDWTYRDGKIVLTPNSSIPYFTREELMFKEKKEGTSLPSKTDGYHVLFSEQGLLQSRQLAVTYIRKKKSAWQEKTPAFAEKLLPNTLAKLKVAEPLHIVFYGNSIEAGANSSITLNQSPFLPTWPEMVVLGLQAHYSGTITYKNRSKGGMLAKWGLENVAALVSSEKPDLVIIGFGMNDGTSKVKPEVFIEQVQGIMQTVRSVNPSCEFIVIATMLANPDAIHSQVQKEYLQPVLTLETTGVAIADMTSVHEALLQRKAYQDMTGNNINHPNDYLARWYAMVINALLIPR